MQITALFILQVINIAIALIFLALFIYRIKYLSHFSQTDKYLHYYPKIRILFALLYVILSLTLLIYNIALKQYQGEAEQYLFAGGGGQTINSLILLLQLAVLRQQLKKQRPYTPTHMIYFFYLVVISVVRFGLTLSNVVKKQNDQILDLILATCLMIDSCIQFGYWIAKKQTMPQFESNNYFSFDQFKLQSNRNLINRNNDLSHRLEQKSVQDDFPYIKSTVKIENGKFKIILEIFVNNKFLPQNFQSTEIQKFYVHPSQIKGKNVSKLLRQSVSRSGNYSKSSFRLEIISEHYYNLEQIKELYILCGRFPLKREIVFTDLPLRQIAKNLQTFLDQVFDQKRNYQQFLLKYFHIDKQFIQIYEQKTKNLQEILISQNVSLNTQKPTFFDKNCIYLSVQIYKQLWIQDHYEFYMKILLKDTGESSYPMRRYKEFEDFDHQVKLILQQKSRNTDHICQLPELPKKHLFHWDQQKIRHRRIQLQLYLRKLCNDGVLMEMSQVRQLILKFLNLSNKILHINPVYQLGFYEGVKVIKGNISKALINNDYVTFYQFKLFRQGIQIRGINKRFSDVVALNEDLMRWMNNIQICYKNIVLPQKHLYKSQTNRHQKLRNYLQSIINIKESYQIYSLSVFFNIAGNTQLSDDTFYSAISFVKSKETFKQSASPNSRGNDQIEMVENDLQFQKNHSFSFSSDLKRMSALIDELGQDDLE